MDQLNFFEIDALKEINNYLCIVKNDVIVNMTYEEIFDSKTFDELYAITYVSSPTFFSKVIKNFSVVRIVLGIDDSYVLTNFTLGLEKLFNTKERIDFWNNLQDDIKEKIQNDSISLRFCSKSPIHSKIYLMRNKRTEAYRVVVGSANLTEAAFSNQKQFEDIIIFDNDKKKFYLYLNKRFNPLFNNGMDYIPNIVKKRNLKENPIILLDKSTAAEILSNDLELNRHKVSILTDEQMAELKSRPQEVIKQYELKKEEIERTTSIISSLYKKKGKVYSLKPFVEIKKQTVYLETIISKLTKNVNEDSRQLLKYWDKDDSIYVVDKENHDIYQLYSALASEEDIKLSLELINKFVDAYKLFAFQKENIYQSKIMEIILFAFMSPFIWKLREEIVLRTSAESNRSTFPIFLVIAGRAASGKTTALEFIGMLLGNNAPYFIPYNKIQKGRTVDKNALESYFGAEYLSPILVDEVPSSFFTGKIGENIIKDVSNNTSGKHPAMICTTNAREFNTSSQVLRRIYYIQVDSEFNIKEWNTESKSYLNDIKTQITDTLFKDFTYRVGQKIKNGEDLYSENDCLYIARTIFRNYYREAGIKLPEWFPNEPFYDYEQRGKIIWKTLYQNNRMSFKDRNDGTIYIETDIFKNSSERENCVNFLGNGCIKEDTQVLLLNSKEFYDFIGIKPQKGFLRVLKSFL